MHDQPKGPRQHHPATPQSYRPRATEYRSISTSFPQRPDMIRKAAESEPTHQDDRSVGPPGLPPARFFLPLQPCSHLHSSFLHSSLYPFLLSCAIVLQRVDRRTVFSLFDVTVMGRGHPGTGEQDGPAPGLTLIPRGQNRTAVRDSYDDFISPHPGGERSLLFPGCHCVRRLQDRRERVSCPPSSEFPFRLCPANRMFLDRNGHPETPWSFDQTPLNASQRPSSPR